MQKIGVLIALPFFVSLHPFLYHPPYSKKFVPQTLSLLLIINRVLDVCARTRELWLPG